MSLLKMLTDQLGGGGLEQISKTLGTDQRKTNDATGAALSTILGALARNSSNQDGARALDRALEKDHDGSVLDNLGGLLGNPQSGPGEGILRHVLGNRKQVVQAGLSRQTGVDSESMGKLMTMLAPVVMGALGRAKRQDNLDAGSLASMLGQQRRQIEEQEPQAMGMIGKMLDADGDGDVDLGDIAKQGAGLLGKFFKK